MSEARAGPSNEANNTVRFSLEIGDTYKTSWLIERRVSDMQAQIQVA